MPANDNEAIDEPSEVVRQIHLLSRKAKKMLCV
jgi:hypothetical protein